ncbi:TPA: ABC-2 transporter permease [Bacillus thuringiensis]|nr:ABC-2 transporter permease [Bacillus cereus]HDR4798189.1 ABC-2 transporter permease [Bacillus cereus]HDR4804277.1 ABC-2 transporter permease [Bacillus cereus]HDR4810285.1 ABC-2 transporter permease [Bacillus cereus]HDR4833629.1 ABC-2 transporter permease [Bacillus cereus]
MFAILKKDILINQKYLLILLLYSIIFPVILIIDGDNKYLMMSFLLPFINVNFFVGKSCYIEDSADVRNFLKMLPISHNKIVCIRYIEMIITLALSSVYVFLVQLYLMNGVSSAFLIHVNLLVCSALLIYFAIYLSVYYKMNYHAAQNTLMFLFVIGVSTFILTEKVFNIKIEMINHLNFSASYIVFIISIIVLFITYLYSIKEFKFNKFA